eukprot:m51a1_g12203 hypothetical protein (1105) ;mRNA; f:61092-73253
MGLTGAVLQTLALAVALLLLCFPTAAANLVARTTPLRSVPAVDFSSDPRSAHHVLCTAVSHTVTVSTAPLGSAGVVVAAYGLLIDAGGNFTVRVLDADAPPDLSTLDVVSYDACPAWLLQGTAAGPCSAFRFGPEAWVSFGAGDVVVVAYPLGAPANLSVSVDSRWGLPVQFDPANYSSRLPIAFRIAYSESQGPGNASACDPGSACPRVCGDGVCAPPETCASCPFDCSSAELWCHCGDGVCGANETCLLCPADCGPCCGNGVCDFPEELRLRSCAPDCLASCNDSVCSPGLGEDCVTSRDLRSTNCSWLLPPSLCSDNSTLGIREGFSTWYDVMCLARSVFDPLACGRRSFWFTSSGCPEPAHNSWTLVLTPLGVPSPVRQSVFLCQQEETLYEFDGAVKVEVVQDPSSAPPEWWQLSYFVGGQPCLGEEVCFSGQCYEECCTCGTGGGQEISSTSGFIGEQNYRDLMNCSWLFPTSLCSGAAAHRIEFSFAMLYTEEYFDTVTIETFRDTPHSFSGTLVFGPGVVVDSCSAAHGSFLDCSDSPVLGVSSVNLTNLGAEANVVYDADGLCLCDSTSCGALNLTVNEADLRADSMEIPQLFYACVDNTVEITVVAVLDPAGTVIEKSESNNVLRSSNLTVLEMPCSNDGTVVPGACSSLSGLCINDNVCQCAEGFEPPSCWGCLPGRWGSRCGLCPACVNGACSQTLGTCVCTGNYAGALCDSCKEGFFGSICEPLEAATRIAPDFGPDTGGTMVHVFIYNIANTSTVQCYWDVSWSTEATFVSQGEVVCLSPPHASRRVPFHIQVDGSRVPLQPGLEFFYTVPARFEPWKFAITAVNGVGAAHSDFRTSISTPAFVAGNITCGARHPADESNWAVQLWFLTEAIWVSPSPADITVYPEPMLVAGFFTLGNYADRPVQLISASIAGAPTGVLLSLPKTFSLGPLQTVDVPLNVSSVVAFATYAFELVFQSIEGPGSASASVTVRVRDWHPRIAVTPPSMSVTLVRGAYYAFHFAVSNEGSQETHDLAVTVPDESPFLLTSPALIPSLAADQESVVSLAARVASDAPLGTGSGVIAVQSDRSSAVFVTSTPSSPTATRLWPAPS